MNRIAPSLCFASVVLAAGTVQSDNRRDQVDALLWLIEGAVGLVSTVPDYLRFVNWTVVACFVRTLSSE